MDPVRASVFSAVHILRARRPNWSIVGVMLLALGSVTVAVYLPLFRVYRTMVPSTFRPGSHDVVQRFLVNAIGPAIAALLLALFLLALDGVRRVQHANSPAFIPGREILLAVGFASILLVGLLGSTVSHGLFIERYFRSSIAAYAVFLAFATSRRQVGPGSQRCWQDACFSSCLPTWDRPFTSLGNKGWCLSRLFLQKSRISLHLLMESKSENASAVVSN